MVPSPSLSHKSPFRPSSSACQRDGIVISSPGATGPTERRAPGASSVNRLSGSTSRNTPPVLLGTGDRHAIEIVRGRREPAGPPITRKYVKYVMLRSRPVTPQGELRTALRRAVLGAPVVVDCPYIAAVLHCDVLDREHSVIAYVRGVEQGVSGYAPVVWWWLTMTPATFPAWLESSSGGPVAQERHLGRPNDLGGDLVSPAADAPGSVCRPAGGEQLRSVMRFRR